MQLGGVYPNHYLIAVFSNLETAQQAVKKLRLAGFAEDEVIAVAGQDFIDLAKEETGLESFAILRSRTDVSRQRPRSIPAWRLVRGSALPDRKDEEGGLERASTGGAPGSSVLRQRRNRALGRRFQY